MKMTAFVTAGALMILLCSCRTVGNVQDDQTLLVFEQELDSIRQRLHVPGMAAAIVSRGAVVWSVGMGHADIEQDIAVTPDTPFRLASVTKTIASTLLMTLVERGELDLDTPMSEFGVTFDNSPDVTVRHVMSHTSEGANPGERYSYSGDRYSRLESVVQATTGMDFSEAVHEMIVDRLSVDNLGASTAYVGNTLASPYVWERRTGYSRGAYPDHISPAAGMIASVSDLAQFDIALDSGLFLTPETRQIAWSPQANSRGTAHPYGLGWFVGTIRGVEIVWHYGYWECISSLYLKAPERDLSLIVLANSDGLSDGFPLASGRLRRSPVARLFLDMFVD